MIAAIVSAAFPLYLSLFAVFKHLNLEVSAGFLASWSPSFALFYLVAITGTIAKTGWLISELGKVFDGVRDNSK